MKKTVSLSHAVLASTLFMSAMAKAEPLTSVYSEPVPNPQMTSTINPELEIAATGQLNATGIDGIQMDQPGSFVIIDPNNTNAGNLAIVATGNGSGINVVNQAGQNSGNVITISSGSVINALGPSAGPGKSDGILVNDTATTISNAGSIIGAYSGIEVAAGGTNTVITNSGATAVIKGGAGASLLVTNGANGGTGLTLTNSGGATISATGNQDAVQINQSFTSIVNNTGSFFTATLGNALNLGGTAVAPITGDVQNFGTIQSSATAVSGGALRIAGQPFNGTVTNNAGGIIQNSAVSGGGGAVVLSNAFNILNNSGTIQATGATQYVNAILVNSGIAGAGTINNNSTGVIQSLNDSATIFLSGNLTGINNAGTIKGKPAVAALGEGVIYAATAGVTVLNGIVNTGTITTTVGPNVINLTNAGLLPLFQNAGTISGGAVLLAGGGGTSLTMNGGTIAGNVTSSSTNASTLQLNGGTITGTTTLGNVANGNIVNLAGTSLQALNGGIGNDTFNLSGGSFTSLDGKVGANIINIPGVFTLNSPISSTGGTNTINVNNGGVFTVNSTIANSANIFVNAGGAMITNSTNNYAAPLTIAANGAFQVNNGSTDTFTTINNSGSLIINPGGVLKATTYTQNAGATYSPGIQSAAVYGKLQTTGASTFLAGSILSPFLNNAGVFIPSGSQFQVVNAVPVVGADPTPPTLQQPQSALVFFEKITNPNDITLTLQLRSIPSVAQGDIPQAIGASLDPLFLGGTTNPELLALFGQLQMLPDDTSLSNALLQLAPSFNYSLPTSSRISMDNAFDSVQMRLEGLHGLIPIAVEEEYRKERDYELYNGVNSGDSNVIYLGGRGVGAWVKAYGTIADQHKRHQIEGFRADATGLAIGADWSITDYFTIGVAESVTKVKTTENTSAQNTLKTRSNQTTFYGWYQPMEPCTGEAIGLYVDTMLAVASDKYQSTRFIYINTINNAASAEFYSLHYGAQADIGYVISSDNWFVAPVARLRYTYLNIDSYSEEGAGGFNLNVVNNTIDETVAGLGLRVATKLDYIQAIYVPEASAMLLYDFSGRAQQMQATFLGGGNPFYIDSIKPAQLIQLYGLGITAYTSDHYSFTIKGNFEYRNEFFGYNGYMQLHYQWD
ncbi:MAG: autotransporter domain-containing protein [Gammaproteobacteria bacterium]|nr:autotransporter domain-containing protein [Gammaproteobacteria bacterium]